LFLRRLDLEGTRAPPAIRVANTVPYRDAAGFRKRKKPISRIDRDIRIQQGTIEWTT
jgi:hypothetical protein